MQAIGVAAVPRAVPGAGAREHSAHEQTQGKTQDRHRRRGHRKRQQEHREDCEEHGEHPAHNRNVHVDHLCGIGSKWRAGRDVASRRRSGIRFAQSVARGPSFAPRPMEQETEHAWSPMCRIHTLARLHTHRISST